jgi:phosphinothricin acetyltransferase
LSDVAVRAACRDDLPRLTEIYNHYVLTTPVTFDVEPYTVERRVPWFEQFATTGRHRLIVATIEAHIVGYAGTTRFRPKTAYDTTVESSIYCSPECVGQGVGGLRLHEQFGFRLVGMFTEVGRKFGRYWDVAWVEKSIP